MVPLMHVLRRHTTLASAAAVMLLLLVAAWIRGPVSLRAVAAVPAVSAGGSAVVVLPTRVRDSMSSVFTRFNEHWDEQGGLNTLEKMLATVGPTQREYLGCLQGTVSADTVRIESWEAARNMKQLPLAVTGDCDGVEQFIGTWHTHPYHADLQNLPVKARALSQQDLDTFGKSSFRAMLVFWDTDSVDAAVKGRNGKLRHPATIVAGDQQ